jgi:hypothetical protein
VIALAAAAALSFAGNCVGSLCGVNELSPFLAKLHQAGARPVHILQIGDSHTAGDTITGAWRDILQQKYGSAGRGVLPPGRPFNGYITQGATVSMSPDWQIAGDFGSAWSSPSPPLGISAYSLTTRTAGASMSISADPNQAFNRFVVCALMRPGGGKLQMRAGVNSVTFDLSSPTERPECRTLRLPSLVTSADVIATDGIVTMTSWATFHDGSGVVLSNLGVVGSQLVHWARTDDAVLTEELRTYKPDLIVIAFGTNEGFSPRVSDFEFEATLRTQIGRVRRIAGNVPILLLGAPDAVVDDALGGGWGTPGHVFEPEARQAYVEALRRPESVHAICEEYRAAAGIDARHDEEDRRAGHRIASPTLVLWSRDGALGSWYQDAGGPLGIWRTWASDLRGQAVAAGHFFAEEIPDETAHLLGAFFSGNR